MDKHYGGALVGRRGFLAVSGSVFAGGCAHCALPPLAPPGTGAAADAHAHFFNAADLPVAGFTKFVLIPRYLPSLPDYALALVDIIAWVVERLARSATEEMQAFPNGGRMGRGGPKPADFAREAARAHRAGLAGKALASQVSRLGPFLAERPDIDLAASHRALDLLYAPAGRSDVAAPVLTEAGFLAMLGEPPTGLERAPGEDDLQCNVATGQAGSVTAQRTSVSTMLRWIVLLCKSRCSHVENYLATIAGAGRRVARATNLLVDYDKWLADGPRSGSRMADQVAYWTRYADVSAKVPGRIVLDTFAGFDPLRDAEERVLENRPKEATSLAEMARWASDGRIARPGAAHRISGFKIYPPMGFRPDCNSSLNVPDARGGRAILRRWAGHGPARIGGEIDKSLNRFFELCVTEDIPVLSHARESNVALPGGGEMAAPAYWLNRVRQLAGAYPAKPLRLCLGHFDLVNCNDVRPPDDEAFYQALILNRRDPATGIPGARVYFDVSFDSRILAGRGKDLFDGLARQCQAAGDEGDFVMFGSDWIMLANQPNVDRYFELAYEAASTNDFWRCRLDKLFSRNFEAFMTPTGSLRR